MDDSAGSPAGPSATPRLRLTVRAISQEGGPLSDLTAGAQIQYQIAVAVLDSNPTSGLAAIIFDVSSPEAANRGYAIAPLHPAKSGFDVFDHELKSVNDVYFLPLGSSFPAYMGGWGLDSGGLPTGGVADGPGKIRAAGVVGPLFFRADVNPAADGLQPNARRGIGVGVHHFSSEDPLFPLFRGGFGQDLVDDGNGISSGDGSWLIHEGLIDTAGWALQTYTVRVVPTFAAVFDPDLDYGMDHPSGEYLLPVPRSEMAGDEFTFTLSRTRIQNAETGRWYYSIQPALNEAATGQTIVLAPGVYSETLNINRNVTIRGERPDLDGVASTILDGGMRGRVVTISQGALRGVTVRNGTATDGGAGVLASGSAVVENCIIRGNSGGGLLARGQVNVRNNLVFENSAEQSGAGLTAQENAVIRNNTIVFNASPSAARPAVVLSGSARFLGNIVAFNPDGAGISGRGQSTDYNCVFGNGDPGSAQYVNNAQAGPHDVEQDPFFSESPAGNTGLPAAAEFFQLASGSPCIDAGDPTFLPPPGATDLGGQERRHCVSVDIGADEWVFADFNCNYFLDLPDFVFFPLCLTGPGLGPVYPGCALFDGNVDDDVDIQDVSAFLTRFEVGCSSDSACDDGNSCTNDACNGGICRNSSHNNVCDDGDACTVEDRCANGVCRGAPRNCNDNNDCTDDGCANGTCQNPPNAAVCNDQNACTVDDRCTNRVCAGTPMVCDDGNPCTTNSCSGGTCTFPNRPAGTPCGSSTTGVCDNADTCNASGVCQANNVANGTACTTDNNDCTNDACHGGVCTHPNEPAGSSCGSSATSVCDNADTCNASGVCQANNRANGTACTSDNNDCTSDQCNFGICAHANRAAGSPCGSAMSGPCDQPDSCSSAGVCLRNNRPNGTLCDDGRTCTTNDRCLNDVCRGDPIGQPGDCCSANCGRCCDHAPCCQAVCAMDGFCCDVEWDANCVERARMEPACPCCETNADCNDGLFCNGPESCAATVGCSPGSPPCGAGEFCNEIQDRCEPLIPPQHVRTVDAGAQGLNNGRSWADAFTSLQDALVVADSSNGAVTEIWVRSGTYTPDQGAGTTPGDRTAAFHLISGVAVYGGFAGHEHRNDQRAPDVHRTVLSGDLSRNDSGFTGNAENSLHVLIASGTNELAVLVGFTIQGGNANVGSGADRDGGGLLNVMGSPTIANCVFIQNVARFGGAISNQTSSPRIVNCKFLGNLAGSFGGGIHNRFAANPTIVNCFFSGNRCNVDGGAISVLRDSRPTVVNCTFVANSAVATGGGFHVRETGAAPTILNTILWGNTDAGGVDESAQIHVLSGAVVVTYSNIQGLNGFASGAGNLGIDPFLTNVAGADGLTGTLDDDPVMLANSPVIDAGSNAGVTPDWLDLDYDDDLNEPIPVDLVGQPRFVDDPTVADSGAGVAPIIDIGAVEFTTAMVVER